MSKDVCEPDASEKVTKLLCASIFLAVQCHGGSLQAGTTPSLVCIPTGSKDPGIPPMLSKQLYPTCQTGMCENTFFNYKASHKLILANINICVSRVRLFATP